MDYSVHLDLQGGPHLQVILQRILDELGEMRNGPGEDEIERISPVLLPLFTTLLEQTGDATTLSCVLTGSAQRLHLDLRLTSRGDGAAAALLAPLQPALDKAFDQVTISEEASEGVLQVILIQDPIR